MLNQTVFIALFFTLAYKSFYNFFMLSRKKIFNF